ncbi:hypothetical protein LB564_17000 [Mesorhizobium sp. ES1-6]|nr:hypothetical protein [Mesorhizobium sp. ES1-6]
MRTLIERNLVVDPYSIQILADGRLLICDFGGFEGSGRVYTVEPLNGHLQVVVEGANLIDPTSAFMDGDGQIWIANGDQNDQDGEVLCFDPAAGTQRVVYPREGNMSGALLGVFPAHDPDFLLATKNEWANRVNTCVLLINKVDGTARKILSGSEDIPKFFSTKGCVVGSTLWIAECVNRELLEVDLPSGNIISRTDLRPIMGGHCGMRNSFDAISAIYDVPASRR